MAMRHNKCDFFFVSTKLEKKFQFTALCNRNEKTLVL